MSRADASTAQLQALIQQGADGAARAYGELLSQASNRLLKLTRTMLRDYPRLQRWEQTDDVFQTAAMRLHRSLSEVKPPTVAAFWGLATAQIRRTLIDLARHHFGPHGDATHHHSDAGERDPAQTVTIAPGGAPSPHSGPASLAEWTEFHQLVEQLPEDERNVFSLTWYAGLSQAEIGELLGISLPTVQRRWYAAKLHLFELTHGERPPAEESHR